MQRGRLKLSAYLRRKGEPNFPRIELDSGVADSHPQFCDLAKIYHCGITAMAYSPLPIVEPQVSATITPDFQLKKSVR
jgi:hypothetical protein